MVKISLNKKKYPVKCTDPSEYDTCEPYEVTLKKGKYLIDCYGASSANSGHNETIGYGAHVSGVLNLNEASTFYIYVGGIGSTSSNTPKTTVPGGYNGGGRGGYGFYKSSEKIYSSGCGGGGGTDIRTVKGAWNDSESIASRIIVAGGGGGWNPNGVKGGSAGDLIGEASYDRAGNNYSGGTQTSGYGLGVGQDGSSKDIYADRGAEGNSGSGGGWYGGFASLNDGTDSNAGGSGGSSFISGYKGLQIINNIEFSYAHMESGSIAKHLGNGLVTITTIHDFSIRCKPQLSKPFILCVVIINLTG